MDAGIIENFNALVAEADTVWVLGDIAMSHRYLPKVSKFNGRKILVPGNHDNAFRGSASYRPGRSHAYLDAGFAEVRHDPVEETFDGIAVALSHFPYSE